MLDTHRIVLQEYMYYKILFAYSTNMGKNQKYVLHNHLVVDSANQATVGLYEKHNSVKGWKRVTHVWKKD